MKIRKITNVMKREHSYIIYKVRLVPNFLYYCTCCPFLYCRIINRFFISLYSFCSKNLSDCNEGSSDIVVKNLKPLIAKVQDSIPRMANHANELSVIYHYLRCSEISHRVVRCILDKIQA